MYQFICQHVDQIWAQCTAWAIVGLVGQAVFTCRFVYQWIVSERRKESIIPVGFWYLSIIGSLILLVYAAKKHDPVFILAYLFNSFIYVRNLMFIHRKQAQEAKA
ncbi:MAG: hypothetical protein GXP25_08960 [Planctomycetes bacterium]|nr:hypothetical protein [Planctomycetota bacterium]